MFYHFKTIEFYFVFSLLISFWVLCWVSERGFYLLFAIYVQTIW